ncbi:MAG: PEP-CTERM sorting domain-containing protein [Burkholderiales bacterium]|nr:PEP-CTERM sorting domain-containing protein [Burkholderiales bacterium]
MTNVFTPCAPFGGAGSCSTSLFSDGLHPSARAHQIVGDFAAVAALSTLAAVPEPETYALMLAGLALVAGIARRRRVLPA